MSLSQPVTPSPARLAVPHPLSGWTPPCDPPVPTGDKVWSPQCPTGRESQCPSIPMSISARTERGHGSAGSTAAALGTPREGHHPAETLSAEPGAWPVWDPRGGWILQLPEQGHVCQAPTRALFTGTAPLPNQLGTCTKMLVFTQVPATLPRIPLCINCSSASELPSCTS